MVGYNRSSTLAAPWLAISVLDIHPGPFTRLTFGVSADRAGTKPEVKQQERLSGLKAVSLQTMRPPQS